MSPRSRNKNSLNSGACLHSTNTGRITLPSEWRWQEWGSQQWKEWDPSSVNIYHQGMSGYSKASPSPELLHLPWGGLGT